MCSEEYQKQQLLHKNYPQKPTYKLQDEVMGGSDRGEDLELISLTVAVWVMLIAVPLPG